MAEKRMFAKSITESDNFLNMSMLSFEIRDTL